MEKMGGESRYKNYLVVYSLRRKCSFQFFPDYNYRVKVKCRR